MSLRSAPVVSRILLIPAGFLTLAYTLLGIVGTGMMGPIVGVKDLVAVYYPLLAFPVFCLVFASLRIAAIFLWIYFLFKWIFWLVISWPHIAFNPLSSKADQLLFLAVVLVLLASIVASRGWRRKVTALE
jgi:hypothetical protein